jgi:hypothetical protein
MDTRVTFVEGDCTASKDPADVVICIGSDHAFGDQSTALEALRDFVRPGGRLLFGSGFWQSPPSLEQAAAVGMTPDSLPDLAGLVELAIEQGRFACIGPVRIKINSRELPCGIWGKCLHCRTDLIC